jgi:MarR family transcriptional regulator, lower aerobic nicotinate degradation pathway regulator
VPARVTIRREADADAAFGDLYGRPGFLLRRGHQIASSAFVQACRRLALTPNQYGVLYSLHHLGALDQTALAARLALDRSTTGLIVELLEKRRLIARRRSLADRRRNELALTAEGKKVFKRAERLAGEIRSTLLGVFSRAERAEFLRLLAKFVDALGDGYGPEEVRSPARSRKRVPKAKAAMTRRRTSTAR